MTEAICKNIGGMTHLEGKSSTTIQASIILTCEMIVFTKTRSTNAFAAWELIEENRIKFRL
jgi:hypothetical protein